MVKSALSDCVPAFLIFHSRNNAWTLQPGCGRDNTSLCIPWCHGSSGILCCADQSQEQAKETETPSQTATNYTTKSSTKDTVCLTAIAKDDIF